MQKSNEEQFLLQIEAVIHSVKTLVDRGLSLTIYTQEMNPEDTAILFALKGKAGWLLFKPSRIAQEDIAVIPEEVKEFKSDRTPSQRLRAVIYRVWEQSGSKETFIEFYGRHIDKIVDQYKSQLDN